MRPEQNEETELTRIAAAIDLGFMERDPFMRDLMAAYTLRLKWKRAAILQGGQP